MLTYRKTKTGDWAVFGPLTEIKEGAVTVRKRDGTTRVEKVLKVSKSFLVDGVAHAYGFLRPLEQQETGGAGRPPREEKVCWECGCRFTYADARRNGGDWQDSYCGC